MKNDTRILIKDLFLFYTERHIDTDNNKSVCWSCFSTAKHDEKTDTYEKLKHQPDCEVTIMRDRVRKIINEDKVG